MDQPRHLSHLDALRGYAILGVIFFHVASLYTLPPIMGRVLSGGSHGVQLFFVVSAVTLMMSWNARNDGAPAFWVRRVFRIMPMWLLAVVGWMILRGGGKEAWAPDGVSMTDVALAVSLLHGLSPTAINGVVPGGWSIAAEATFYVFFPLLAFWITSPVKAVILCILALAVCFAGDFWLLLVAQLPYPRYLVLAFIEFWFINQLPVFAFGILVYQCLTRWKAGRPVAEGAVLLALLAIIAVPLLIPPYGQSIQYGVVLALLAFGMGQGGGRYLVNPVSVWIGQRSYSAYFWHFAFLQDPINLPHREGGLPAYLLQLAIILVLTLAASHLSYTFIEKPGIAVGKELAKRVAAFGEARRPRAAGPV